MRSRSSKLALIIGIAAVIAIAVGAGWSKRTRAEVPRAPSEFDDPDIRYDELLPSPKPVPTKSGVGANVPVAVAEANSKETKQSVDATRAFAEKSIASETAAWSVYTALKVQEAQAKAAEYEAAAAGLGEAGVK